MILRAALLLALLGAAPVAAQGVAEQASQASTDLQAAVAALQEAEGAKDRVAALTATIRAYEDGLAALREALRQASLRETALNLRFETQRERIAQLLGVLARMEAEPGPLLLLHPSGPLGTVRSGMMLADVTPALQGEATRLKGELEELRDLRELQVAAGETLTKGLDAAQQARAALSQAARERLQELLDRVLRGMPAEAAGRFILDGLSRFVNLAEQSDDVSLLVRQQYEENPYPRWVTAESKIFPAQSRSNGPRTAARRLIP